MNNKLHYLALTLLFATGLNAAPVQTAHDEVVAKGVIDGVVYAGLTVKDTAGTLAEEALEAWRNAQEETSTEVSSDESSEGVMASVQAIPGAIQALAQNGVSGIESFVVKHPKSIAGVATVTAVAAVYYGVKYYNASTKVATLEEQLEEANAIKA